MKEKAGKIKTLYMTLAFVTLAAWTGFIFYNSLQTASESLEQSGFFVDLFTNIIRIVYGGAIPRKILGYIELRLVDDIRNLAHIFEFFVLYILSYVVTGFIRKIVRRMSAAFVYGLVVILLDETIQIFVDGRGFQIKDILLDSMGMILAFLGIVFVLYLKAVKSKKAPDENRP